MLVTWGLGRKSNGSLLATLGLGRLASAAAELQGRAVRRWRSRLRRRDLESLPITDQREFKRRVQAALAALEGDASTETRKHAERAKKGILAADSVRRRSLLRVDWTVYLAKLDVIEWALDAWHEQLERRRRDEDEFIVLALGARYRGML